MALLSRRFTGKSACGPAARYWPGWLTPAACTGAGEGPGPSTRAGVPQAVSRGLIPG